MSAVNATFLPQCFISLQYLEVEVQFCCTFEPYRPRAVSLAGRQKLPQENSELLSQLNCKPPDLFQTNWPTHSPQTASAFSMLCLRDRCPRSTSRGKSTSKGHSWSVGDWGCRRPRGGHGSGDRESQISQTWDYCFWHRIRGPRQKLIQLAFFLSKSSFTYTLYAVLRKSILKQNKIVLSLFKYFTYVIVIFL